MSQSSDPVATVKLLNPVEDRRGFPVSAPRTIRLERTDRTGRCLLAIAMLSGIGLMIPTLTAGPLVLDECGTYWIAGDGPLTLWQRSLNYENIPPLSPWLHRMFMDVLGESEWSFRTPSVIWYLAAIAFSYLLGREFGGPLHGGLCAIVIAWHPTALGEIRLARCYSLTLLLSVICYWVVVRSKRDPHNICWPFLWALVALALVWTHYLNAAVVIASLSVLAWQMAQRSVRGFFSLSVALALLISGCLPLFAPLVRMAEWGKSFGYQTEAPILETVSALLWLGLPVGLISGKAVAFFLRRHTHGEGTKVHRNGFTELVLWGLVPAVAAVIICRGDFASLANPRYRIGFEAASGCLVVSALTVRMGKSASMVAVAAALIASWSVSERLPWQPKRLGTPQSFQWKELAVHVENEGISGEPLFVQSGLGESFLIPAFFEDEVLLDYAGCRLGRFYVKTDHPRFGLPFNWQISREMNDFYRDLVVQNMDTDHKSAWVASATDTDLCRASFKVFDELLLTCGYDAMKRIELPDAILVHYRVKKEE